MTTNPEEIHHVPVTLHVTADCDAKNSLSRPQEMSLRLAQRAAWRSLSSRTRLHVLPIISVRYGSAEAVRAYPRRSIPNAELTLDASESRPNPDLTSENKIPFADLKGRINHDTLKALTKNPMNLTWMTPVQAAVLPLLPDLARPYQKGAEQTGPRDLLVKAKTGTGKTIAFLIPAVEARLNAIKQKGKVALEEAGVENDRELRMRTERIFSKNMVGTLIISPTRELATQIAVEAQKICAYQDMGVQLFVGGVSKGHQMRAWRTMRRDFVVATPGRLNDLLENEPGFASAFKETGVVSSNHFYFVYTS